MIDSEELETENIYKYFTTCFAQANPLGIFQLLIRFLDFVSMDNKNFIPIDDFFNKLEKQDLQNFYDIPIVFSNNPYIIKHYYWFLNEYIRNLKCSNVNKLIINHFRITLAILILTFMMI